MPANHIVFAQDDAGGGGGAFQNVYTTSDGISWSLFRGDDGGGSGVGWFWIDEFNANQNAVAVTGSGIAYYTLNGGTTCSQSRIRRLRRRFGSPAALGRR